MEAPGGLAGKLGNVGMAILNAANLKEASKLGTEDPTVQSGMLDLDSDVRERSLVGRLFVEHTSMFLRG